MQPEEISAVHHNRFVPALYLFPLLLLCAGVFLLWPYYRFYIDPDAISYLTLVDSYLAGDYQHAVNAFWSPMGCWATVLVVKLTGLPLFAAAITANTLPAAGMVILGQALFHRFRYNAWERLCFGIMSALFWTYTVYFQSFTDIWQFFFLTLGLLILLQPSFTRRPLLWVLLGLVAALSYFSKAYSFYFFPLMILVVSGMQLRGAGVFSWGLLFRICLVSVGVMMLAAAPWLWLIHEKYRIWTSSTAGKLNFSWWLAGTQELRPDISVLVPPPPYYNSIFYFEDPYLVQGRFVHFYDSLRLFIKQLGRVGFNAIGWVESANRISPFYFVTWLVSIVFLFSKGLSFFNTTEKKILLVVFLIFPLPYWTVTFDGGRYLWFTIPLSAILGLWYAQLIFPLMSERMKRLFVFVFCCTYLVAPVADMKEMFGTGREEYRMSEAMKSMGIQGSFVSNLSYASGKGRLHRIAWFTGSPWYCHTLDRYSNEEILKDARRYHVQYYYYFYEGTGADYVLKDGQGNPYPEVTGARINGLRVFRLGF